jgi:hypothetical protein
MLICAVIHFSDDLIKANAQVSNAQNGLSQCPVYYSQIIVGWNTHFLVRKWEMLAHSIAQIVFEVFHWTPVTSFNVRRHINTRKLRRRFLAPHAIYHTFPQDTAKSSQLPVH